MGQHQRMVDVEPEAPRDPALHAARLFFGSRRGDGTFQGSGVSIPEFLHSDHRAIDANIRVGRTVQLKKYPGARQKFPLSLPRGPRDANTALFDALAAKCVKPKPTRAPGKDWISKGTWKLTAKRASLMRSGKIRQVNVRRMQRKVKLALKADKSWLTANVGERIVLELR